MVSSNPPRTYLWGGLALMLAGNATMTTLAQELSPTEVFIQVQNSRFHPHKTPNVSHESVSRQGSFVRSRVTLTAPTEAEARRAATHEAYAQAVNDVIVPRADLRGLSRRLAATTAELKNIKATLISDKKTPLGYTVDVEVVRNRAQILSETRSEALSNYRWVAMLPEDIDGRRVSSPLVETALVGKMVDDGYMVYDVDASATSQSSEITPASFSAEEAPIDVGTRYFANIAIVGTVHATFSQDNDGIISYLAEANFRAVQVSTGRVLMAEDINEKGFGRDRSQAARNALTALAATVSTRIPDKFRDTLASHSIEVQPTDQTADSLAEMRGFLAGLHGVTDVSEVSTPRGQEFQLKSLENPAVIATAISNTDNYEVTGVHQGQN